RGHQRGRPRPPGSLRRGDTPHARPGGADATGAGGARPPGSDADPGLAESTRLSPAGELVLLEDQDRSRWDRCKIEEGSALIERAGRLGAAGIGPVGPGPPPPGASPGPYQLQAAIAAAHARAARPE